jgi:ABC-type glycerol-3-phosphate transport system substrate-binding protein
MTILVPPRKIRANLAAIACSSALLAALPAAWAGAAPVGPTNQKASSNAPVGKFPGVHLTLSRWSGDPWTSEQEAAAKQWGKATGATITFAAVPYESLKTQQTLTLSGAGGYDILYVHPSWFGAFAKAGYLAPIGSYLGNPGDNPAGFGAKSYVPSILAQGAYAGKQYCLPDFVSTIVVAYRKDLFAKYGLQAPTTLASVLKDASFFNGKSGMAGIALPGEATGAISDVVTSMLAAQGNYWYSRADKPTLNIADATKAVQFYIDAAKYAPSGLLDDAVDDAALAGATGKAAMVISTTPSLSALNDSTKSTTVGKWGFAPIEFAAGKPAGELIYWDWCVAAKSPNVSAAYSFLQWYTNGPQQATIAVEGATAGATKNFYRDKTVLAKLPFLPAMQAALAHSNPQPSISQWAQLQPEIESDVQKAVEGKVTAAKAARDMHQALVSSLG